MSLSSSYAARFFAGICLISLAIGAAAQHLPQSATGNLPPGGRAEEAFSDFAGAAAIDPCEQLAPGSAVSAPTALYISNGKLEVNFSFVTGIDSNGLTRRNKCRKS